MSFNTNLKQTPLAAGTFPAMVRGTKEKKTKHGDPMVIVTWELQDGPDKGRTLDEFVSFVPQMIGRNNHLLKLLGQPHGEEVEVDAMAWVGRSLTLKLAPEVQNGQVRTKVVEYLATEGASEELPF